MYKRVLAILAEDESRAITVSIKLEKSLLDRADKLAKDIHATRSAFIRACILAVLEEKDNHA